ncbi:unnamed protein product [Boreogadus saida]
MVYHCVCAGCNNSSKTGHRVHAFPKDKATLRQWVQFVRVRRADFSIPSVTKNSKVCSAHFREEDYDQGDVRMVSLGLKRLAHLIPNAVPSVHTHLSACPAPKTERHQDQCRQPQARAGYDVTVSLTLIYLRKMLTDASTCETTDSVNAATVEDPLPYSTCDTGTQCILKPLGRSHAVQVNLKPKMETRCLRRMRRCCVRSQLQLVTPTKMALTNSLFGQEELMALFAICPACCEKSDSRIVQQEGTFVKIEQVCACGYQRFWQNQPILHRNMPTCNLLLSGAIHFSGCLATQTLRMMTLFGLQCISASTFFRHQRRYTIPVIIQAWQNEQAKNFSDLKAMDGGLVVAGDCSQILQGTGKIRLLHVDRGQSKQGG